MTPSTNLWQTIRQTLSDHLAIWLVPTIVIGTLGSIFALVKSSTWESTQAMLVRDEAVGELGQDGRFDTTDARKAAQETIIQIARNRQVVLHALEQVGPKEGHSLTKPWPSENDIKALQDNITVRAPKGAEFGQSDLIHLQLKAKTSNQAVELNRAVSEQLIKRLQELRNRRAKSVIQELQEKVKLTQTNLDDATAKLEAMERQVGSDLGELRTLNQSGAGESNLRTSLNQIKSDLRTNESTRTEFKQQLKFLQAAEQDPETLVATSNRLLESQPALRRLKDGLIDAQLRVATLLGDRNPAHPAVKAAMTAEAEIRQHLHAELSTAVRGVRADLKVTDAIIDSLTQQLTDVQGRLDKLASLRARYSNLVAEVQHRGDQVKEAQRSLASAKAAREASATASLITLIDSPDPGDGPVGPGRMLIIAASWLGGLMTGIGLLLLTIAPAGANGGQGRRWNDRVGVALGRRSTDKESDQRGVRQNTGRRQADRGKIDDDSSPNDRETPPLREQEPSSNH